MACPQKRSRVKAKHGFVSQENLDYLESMRPPYLLGARLQSEPPLSKAKEIEGPSDGESEDEVERLDA